MPTGVKRGYRSDLRATQAAQTRRAIVAAASELFATLGYGATTVDAVAKAAGVSRKTVFTSVGGKFDLLKTALDYAVTGDDLPEPLADRVIVRKALDHPDPKKLIAGWVRVLAEIDSRVGPLMRALEIASTTDVEAHALVEKTQRQRLAGARSIVRRLGTYGALKDGLNRDQAVDVAWLATDPILHDRMVRVREWSQARFEKWLTAFLVEQLIGG
jgi:AcrR family transcriptional regulator